MTSATDPTSEGMTHPPPSRERRFRLIGAAASAAVVLAIVAALETWRLNAATALAPRAVRWIWAILPAAVPAIVWFTGRVPLRGPGLWWRLAAHLAAMMLLVLVYATAFAAVARRADPTGVEWAWAFFRGLTGGLPLATVVYIAAAGTAQAIASLDESRRYAIDAARLAQQLAEARLGALRMQLHPHFLFNSLNAITVLVRDGDTAAAERMLELLSALLRRALGATRHEVPLHEELAFLEQYLAIEQVRFPDRLHVVIGVDDAVRCAAVPLFLLQPLVENAIRHGIGGRGDAGLIEVAARRDGDRLVLSVRDDGPGLAGTGSSGGPGGVGLANTRERLDTLHGALAGLELRDAPAGGAVATVWLPFRDVDGCRQEKADTTRARAGVVHV